jgi:predicted cupin superfamily sugar epimerase
VIVSAVVEVRKTMNPDDIIESLGLKPHPEGGWYAETYRDAGGVNGRAHATAIYFLLKAGERSHWHRVDAAEIWLWHAGAPLKLGIGQESVTLGPDLAAGQRPQAVVPPDAWQAAEPLGDFTLVSCVVAPGFEFSGFELAPPAFEPS